MAGEESSAKNTERGKNATAKSRLATKIGLSFLFGVIAFLLAQGLDSEVGPAVILGIGASVFISGVAFVTQFLMEVEDRIDDVGRDLKTVERRYEERSAWTQQIIREEFLKINAATELFGLVEASALKTDAMTQLVKNSTSVKKNTPSLVFDFAQAEISRLSGYLKDLGQGGDVTYEGEDRDWLLGLTRVASTSIDATSLTTVDAGGRSFVDGGLWNSDLGQQYLKVQREAIRRGVAIRRIFIIDRPELQDDAAIQRVMRYHANIGVQVRTLRPDDEVAGTPRAALFDFIVIDGVLSYQATVGSRVENSPPIIVATSLITNEHRVQERVERYKDLWASAQLFQLDHPTA